MIHLQSSVSCRRPLQICFICDVLCGKIHIHGANGSILRLGVGHAPAGQVALHLGLVDAVHRDPYHAAPHQDGPEGVALQWVRVKTAMKGKVLLKG